MSITARLAVKLVIMVIAVVFAIVERGAVVPLILIAALALSDFLP